MRENVKIAGGVISLLIFTAVLFLVFVNTVLSAAVQYIYQIPIVGVIITALALTGGRGLARRGINQGNHYFIIMGVAILQLTYGAFGAAILELSAATGESIVLIAFLSTAIAVGGIILVVDITDRSFSSWESYSSNLFIGVLVFSFIGSYYSAFIYAAFFCAITGFIVLTVYELWNTKKNNYSAGIAIVSIYVAIAGIVVHMAQLVGMGGE